MYCFLSNVDNNKNNENDKMWSGAANGKFSQIIQKNMADTKNDGRKKGLIRPMCLKALKIR